MMKNNKWTKEELDYLRNVYPHVGLEQSVQDLDRTKWAIESRVTNMGIKSQVHDKLVVESRAKSCIDLNYFEDMDTYNQGYILGFLLADGSMCSDCSWTKVEIHSKDREILDFIKEELEMTAKVTERSKRDLSSLTISTQKINKRLYELGMRPNKASFVQFPKFLTGENCLRGVVSGILDGDGSVSWNEIRSDTGTRRANPLRINFTSNSKDFLQGINETISYFTQINEKNIYGNKLFYYTKDAEKVANWTYQSNNFHLQRKHYLCKPFLH